MNTIDKVIQAIQKYESGEDRVLPSLKPGFANKMGKVIWFPNTPRDKNLIKWEQDREDDMQSWRDDLMCDRAWKNT